MKTVKKSLWIPKLKEGALSRQLGIPIIDNIPITLLKAIKNADIGETVRNPTKKGKRRFKVTKLLKQRSVLALTLKGFRKKK